MTCNFGWHHSSSVISFYRIVCCHHNICVCNGIWIQRSFRTLIHNNLESSRDGVLCDFLTPLDYSHKRTNYQCCSTVFRIRQVCSLCKAIHRSWIVCFLWLFCYFFLALGPLSSFFDVFFLLLCFFLLSIIIIIHSIDCNK